MISWTALLRLTIVGLTLSMIDTPTAPAHDCHKARMHGHECSKRRPRSDQNIRAHRRHRRQPSAAQRPVSRIDGFGSGIRGARGGRPCRARNAADRKRLVRRPCLLLVARTTAGRRRSAGDVSRLGHWRCEDVYRIVVGSSPPRGPTISGTFIETLGGRSQGLAAPTGREHARTISALALRDRTAGGPYISGRPCADPPRPRSPPHATRQVPSGCLGAAETGTAVRASGSLLPTATAISSEPCRGLHGSNREIA